MKANNQSKMPWIVRVRQGGKFKSQMSVGPVILRAEIPFDKP